MRKYVHVVLSSKTSARLVLPPFSPSALLNIRSWPFIVAPHPWKQMISTIIVSEAGVSQNQLTDTKCRDILFTHENREDKLALLKLTRAS